MNAVKKLVEIPATQDALEKAVLSDEEVLAQEPNSDDDYELFHQEMLKLAEAKGLKPRDDMDAKEVRYE